MNQEPSVCLFVKHNCGFFSCCSVRLHEIIQYFNSNKKLPDTVDSSYQFMWYKLNTNKDITFDYFHDYQKYGKIEYVKKIDYFHIYQFIDYSRLNYLDISPFIVKYFSPSNEITKNILDMKLKYHVDYENTCVLFYRGNDKITETSICEYDEYVIHAQEVVKKNPKTKFLIQSDETEFIEKMLSLFPENSFYLKDEIRHMNKCINTVDKLFRDKIDVFSKNYLAITIMMSKCKYIICGSGNCSIWIMFYRGNNKNVYQNLNGYWITPNSDN